MKMANFFDFLTNFTDVAHEIFQLVRAVELLKLPLKVYFEGP
jgi:hypothetical protein